MGYECKHCSHSDDASDCSCRTSSCVLFSTSQPQVDTEHYSANVVVRSAGSVVINQGAADPAPPARAMNAYSQAHLEVHQKNAKLN